MKKVFCLLVCLVLLSSCSPEIPRLSGDVTLQCDELLFDIIITDIGAGVSITEPKTLCGMVLTVTDKVVCSYKGLQTEIPESACKRIITAVKAIKAINCGSATVTQITEEQEILTYTLDETLYQVYYNRDIKKIVGFITDDIYYGVKY